MKSPEGGIQTLFLVGGCASSLCQLLALREQLTLLQGNEFVLALSLFNWLTLGGLGAWLGSRAATGSPRNGGLIAVLALMIVLAPLQPLGMRLLREALFTGGSAVGFYGALFFSAVTLAPAAVLLGLLFPLTLAAIHRHHPGFPGSRGYILESTGSIAGGLLFSFWLVYRATPFQAAALAGLLLLAGTLSCLGIRPILRGLLLVAGLIPLLGLLLERDSLTPIRGELVDYRETPYGRLCAVKDRGQVTLFADGLPFMSSQDPQSAEEAAHLPLAQIDQPGRVLLIGGGGELLTEVAKHRPRAVDLVELNPALTEMQERLGLLRRTPTLEILHRDGRRHLQESDRRYDAILVNLPEPETFQINRFFTTEFFALARRRLEHHGVLAFSLQGYDNYLDEVARRKLTVVLATVRDHFPEVLVLPGGRVHFLCSAVSLGADFSERLQARGVATAYLSAYLDGDLTPARIAHLQSLLNPSQSARNRDLKPVLMQIMFSQWFLRFGSSPVGFYLFLAVLLAVFLLRVRRLSFVLFTTGYAAMGCELVLIFAFQMTYGYLYQQIGLIVTACLAGLPPGAWLGRRRWGRLPMALMVSDMLILGWAAFLLGLLASGFQMPVAAYLLLGFLGSMACGFQFPLVLHRQGEDPRTTGTLFAADLFGAAWGTLVTSIVLIPQMGLLWATGGVMAVKLVSLIVTMVSHDSHRQTAVPAL